MTTKYLPGQDPYSPAEEEVLVELLSAACEAEEIFSLDELEEAAAAEHKARCDAGMHPHTQSIGVNQEYGWDMVNCIHCGTTICIPIPWCSPHVYDYIPGHEWNAWGPYRNG